MFRVPPLLGVPEPGFTPWTPDDRDAEPEPPPELDDELPPHAATTTAKAVRPTPEANAVVRLRIDALLSSCASPAK
jgi:hypothetical protein